MDDQARQIRAAILDEKFQEWPDVRANAESPQDPALIRYVEELLHWLYTVEELNANALGRDAYYALRSADVRGRTLAAVNYARGRVTHASIIVCTLGWHANEVRQLHADGEWKPVELRVLADGEWKATKLHVAHLSWVPASSIPRRDNKPDPHGRDADYATPWSPSRSSRRC